MRTVPLAPLSSRPVATVRPRPGAPPPGPSPLTNPENWHQLSGKPLSWPKETASLLLFPPAACSPGQWAVGRGAPVGKDPASLPPPSAGLCPCCPGEQTNAREETGWDVSRAPTRGRAQPRLPPPTIPRQWQGGARCGEMWGSPPPSAWFKSWLHLLLARWSQAPAFSESVSLPIRGKDSTDCTSHPTPTPSLTRDGRPAPGGEVGVGGRSARTRGSCSGRGGVSHQEEHPVYKRGAKHPGRPPGEAGKGKKGGQVPCDGARPACPLIFQISGHLHLLISYCIPSHILSIRGKETSKILASSRGAKHPDRDRVDAGIQTNNPGPKCPH